MKCRKIEKAAIGSSYRKDIVWFNRTGELDMDERDITIYVYGGTSAASILDELEYGRNTLVFQDIGEYYINDDSMLTADFDVWSEDDEIDVWINSDYSQVGVWLYGNISTGLLYDEDGRKVGSIEIYRKKANNYVDKQEAVASSLTQRLSILKGELWYAIREGLPLFEKNTNKAVFDTYIMNKVLQHPNVKGFKDFKSSVNKHTYSCSMSVQTEYGDIEISI